MKTVRLSRQLKWDITKAAEKKFDNANPQQQLPDDGYAVVTRLGIVDKIEATKKMFTSIWSTELPMRDVDYVKIEADIPGDHPNNPYGSDDDSGMEREVYYKLNLPAGFKAPQFLSYYETMTVPVLHTDPTLIECMIADNYNEDLRKKRREHTLKLDLVMDRFSTLNQLLKAAPYVKDLVPQEKITKMHEVDDRSGRRAALAEIANDELQELRETLLEDALLGDD